MIKRRKPGKEQVPGNVYYSAISLSFGVIAISAFALGEKKEVMLLTTEAGDIISNCGLDEVEHHVRCIIARNYYTNARAVQDGVVLHRVPVPTYHGFYEA